MGPIGLRKPQSALFLIACGALLIVTMTALAQTSTPAAAVSTLSAASQRLLALARELDASDAVTTLEVWNDAARKGMPLQDLGELKQLFQLQLTVAVLAWHDKNGGDTYIGSGDQLTRGPGKAIWRGPQTGGKPAGMGKGARAQADVGRFEGNGSGPLNAFLKAVWDVRTGLSPSGQVVQLTDGQRAGNVNTTGSALSVARPIGPTLSDPNWGAVMGAAGGIIEAALPNNASPVGLAPPQASMNTVGLVEVQKFTAAIGGDMQLYNDWMAFRSEPAPLAVANMSASPNGLPGGMGWNNIRVMERDLKQPINSQLQTMYVNDATKTLMADYQKEGPNGAAVQAFLKLANLTYTGNENGTDYHAQGDVNQLGIPDNQSVIPQVVGSDVGAVLQDTRPVTAGGPHSKMTNPFVKPKDVVADDTLAPADTPNVNQTAVKGKKRGVAG